MGVAVLLFGILVGIFHFQGDEAEPQQQVTLSAEPVVPVNYTESAPLQQTPVVATEVVARNDVVSPYAALVTTENIEQLAQSVADLVAANPTQAASIVTIAMAQIINDSTLGDVALLAGTATKAAPAQAPAIAGAITRSIGSRSDAALAAAIATIVSLVPEQADKVGMVVGGIVGNDADALAMVAQTIAISVGEETFSSLSAGSGVSMSELMKRSASFGIKVPFDVPNYAAQFAPSASMVADSADDNSVGEGDM
jgi:hypothetical protein